MEREKLFRGKSLNNGEWVEGYYGILGKDTDLEKHVIMVSTLTDGRFYFTDVEVDKETVGQCTGLEDKKGNRIFEGDILEIMVVDTGEDILCEVCFGEFVDNNDCQYYIGFYVKNKEMTVSILNGKDDGYNLTEFCEVFSSIHDNPELLEVQ